MSDINIKYKDTSIATMDSSGTKTLQTQGKYCEDNIVIEYTKPSGGETWVFDELPGEPVIPIYTDISFQSNSITFNKISITTNIRKILIYDTTTVYGDDWTAPAYRKITFATPPTGDLLTYLQDNAVKQESNLAVETGKTLDITSNGATTITPTEPFDAMDNIAVNVNVASDVSLYDYAQAGYQGKNFASNKVTEVRQYAFNACTNLESVSMPNLTAVDINAFANCTNLTEFNAPNLAFIFEQAFISSGIKELDLNELQDIGGNAFANSPLEKLVLRNPTEVAPLTTTCVFNTPISRGEGFIYVTDSLLANYKSEYPSMETYFKPISLMNYASNPVAWIDSEFNTADGHSDTATTLADLSGNGHNATIHGTLPYENKGYRFTGNVANYISVDALTSLSGNKPLTIEFCYKLKSLTPIQRFLYAKNWYENYISSNKIHLEDYFTGARLSEVIDTDLNMVVTAITLDENSVVKRYKNGVVTNTGTYSNINMTPAEIQLGQGDENTSNPAVDGTMFYALRIYDRALSQTELQRNYQNDLTRFS